MFISIQNGNYVINTNFIVSAEFFKPTEGEEWEPYYEVTMLGQSDPYTLEGQDLEKLQKAIEA